MAMGPYARDPRKRKAAAPSPPSLPDIPTKKAKKSQKTQGTSISKAKDSSAAMPPRPWIPKGMTAPPTAEALRVRKLWEEKDKKDEMEKQKKKQEKKKKEREKELMKQEKEQAQESSQDEGLPNDQESSGEDENVDPLMTGTQSSTSLGTYPGLPEKLTKLPNDLQKTLNNEWVREQFMLTSNPNEVHTTEVTTKSITSADAQEDTEITDAMTEAHTLAPAPKPLRQVYRILRTTYDGGKKELGYYATAWGATVAALELATGMGKISNGVRTAMVFKAIAGAEGVERSYGGWEFVDGGLLRAGWVHFQYSDRQAVYNPEGGEHNEEGEPVDDDDDKMWYGVEVKQFEVLP